MYPNYLYFIMSSMSRVKYRCSYTSTVDITSIVNVKQKQS